MSGDLADAEWSVFIAKLENAEEEFVRGAACGIPSSMVPCR